QPGGPARDTSPAGSRVCRTVRTPAVPLDHVANDEGYDQLVLVRAIRSGRSANITCCHSPVSRMSATYPASAYSACRSWPVSLDTSRPAVDPGTADQAGGRLSRRESSSPPRWCRALARALMYNAARGAGHRRDHGKLGTVRLTTHRSALRAEFFAP